MEVDDVLPACTHTASVRIIRSAHRSGESAVLRDGDLGGGGRRDLGGGNCASENEGGNNCANNELHNWITPKVVFTSEDFAGQIS